MNEFVSFAFLLFTANKTNSFVRFLGESMARPNCFWFYLTFSLKYLSCIILIERVRDISENSSGNTKIVSQCNALTAENETKSMLLHDLISTFDNTDPHVKFEMIDF
jgi:hypothetical protein